MTRTLRTKAVAIVVGLFLALSMSSVAQAVDAYPPGVTPVKCGVKVVRHKTHLYVNMGPNQPGARYYTFQIDVKVGKRWYRSLKHYKTFGVAETRMVNVPKGTYRIHCEAKYGFKAANSRTVYVRH